MSPPPPRIQNLDDVGPKWFHNAGGKRINTDMYVYTLLSRANPDVEILDTNPYSTNIAYYVTTTGDGTVESLARGSKLSALSNGTFVVDDACFDRESGRGLATQAVASSQSSSGPLASLNWIDYLPPARRLDGGSGYLVTEPLFDSFLVKWHGHEFKVYLVDCRDGTYPFQQKRQYVLTTEPSAALTLLRTAGNWQNVLHGEIWVFDQGFWQKDAGLFHSIQKSSWSDIILPEELKEDLLKTVLSFYDSRETYSRLRVPWKRGLIFYGPPGNGKTVSIKATMKTLLDREESVPTLYVKSLASWQGPEASISYIFTKAREQAPCYLVFEDLDSLVGDEVRSFFLNAVDGLSENEGILMVGSTNHLERLDPGIAKRPSRFDRKYLFPDPALEERKRYCQYWQRKLKDNNKVKYPDLLVAPIASLMDGFSFAYMQEAFVSTLLKIANDEQGDGRPHQCEEAEDHWDVVEGLGDLEIVGHDKDWDDDDDDDDTLDKYLLWREIKVQIANLRKELGRGDD